MISPASALSPTQTTISLGEVPDPDANLWAGVFRADQLQRDMKKFTVYTKDPCPFCVRAIRLLTELNLPFEEIDLTDRIDELIALKKTHGWQTVPLILWGDELIGGYTDLKEQVDSGRFAEVKS